MNATYVRDLHLLFVIDGVHGETALVDEVVVTSVSRGQQLLYNVTRHKEEGYVSFQVHNIHNIHIVTRTGMGQVI